MRFLLILTLALSSGSYAFEYNFKINLTRVENDQLLVEVQFPATGTDTLIYSMPKVVPGTYSIYNFGRFTHSYQAFDSKGNLLQIDSLNPNQRAIIGAADAIRLTYMVEDTYDTEKGNKIFEPAGTNFEDDQNFILNTFGIFGYFEEYKNEAYSIHFTHEKGFFGATSLTGSQPTDTTTVFTSNNYVDLADSPIMFCEPDTTTLPIANADVTVAVYSPKGTFTSKMIMDEIKPILEAQENYLGGDLPVDRYYFIFYFSKDFLGGSGGFGALEHSYSSMYYLPEVNPEYITQTIRDVAAHEFFHIVTPLNIHSEEIGNFDFVNPEMSQHLWMYEGLTEYAAHHVQAKEGLITLDDFLNEMRTKMQAANSFNDTLPFTEMSEHVLTEFKDQYLNVYQKGALINLCLDILLRDLSEGKYGTQDLMEDLSQKYGKDRSFDDDSLFQEIEALTYPEIGEFLRTHVGGPVPLPYEEIFRKVGIVYARDKVTQTPSFGGIALGYNPETQRLKVNDISEMNKMGEDMGYQVGDEMLTINGEPVKIETAQQQLDRLKSSLEEGDKFVVEVMREGKKKKLKSRIVMIETTEEYYLKLMEDPAEEQVRIRKAWIGQ